jgi:hypothetical protein
VEVEAVAEDIIGGDVFRNTADNFVIFLQWVHGAEGSHIECVSTWRPHAHKLSTRSELSFVYHMLLYHRKLQIHCSSKLLSVFSEYLVLQSHTELLF